ncbi:hypothetical protein CEXT_656811, partial [Caerostris extrusa]
MIRSRKRSFAQSALKRPVSSMFFCNV